MTGAWTVVLAASLKLEAWQPITVSLYFVTGLAICDSFPVGLLITPC